MESLEDSPHDEVYAWCVLQIERTGVFSHGESCELVDEGYDHHQVLDLLAKGCNPRLALRIARPA